MIDDDESFATSLSNYIGIYSQIRMSAGCPMSAVEVANACLACIALVAEQFGKKDQERLWIHCHEAMDELAAACETPSEKVSH